MIYKIAVCDDAEADRQYVCAMVRQWAENTGRTVQVRAFPSAESFLFQYREEPDYDILLLDIEMGAMDGVTMAKRLRRENQTMQIVFITGYAGYMAEGFEVSALHYLMKPVIPEKLAQVLSRAVLALKKAERMVFLPVEGETLRIPADRIEYAEAFSHSVEIAAGKETYRVKLPISELEKLLGEGFLRCHRSYLVGLRHIARLSRTEVILDSGKALPLSRSAAPIAHRAFVSYYAGEKDETV